MKRLADFCFRKNENNNVLLENNIGNKQLTPWERKRNGDEKQLSKIPEEKENKNEHLTATYWG
ncbi:MAG: hypothetical protein L7F78_17115 [Syntrophales bacterium LBB04]|nr:hypothetical protein [Syntrophales bacterium LBB04]